MALIYFPFDAGPGASVTEDQWRKMARFWRDTGVLANEDNQFAVSEHAPNDMSVDVATGKAWLRGHYLESTSVVNVALTAAHASLNRIDRIILRVDFGANTIAVDKLTGAPGASPSAPALTQSTSVWEISLAQVSVPAADTSIQNAQITDERTFSIGGGSASVASKVSDLGPASQGRIGLIRPVPLTTNAGGATALPAAIITVADNADFPTAGTLNTPNGVITYTGKTYSISGNCTFTGCTGGVGTLSANAVITLASGTPPTGYEEIGLVYDSVLGKWVSAPMYPVLGWSDLAPGNGTEIRMAELSGIGTGALDNNLPRMLIPWRIFDNAGLLLQARFVGQVYCNTGASNSTLRLLYRGVVKKTNPPQDNLTGVIDGFTGSKLAVTTIPTTEATGWFWDSGWQTMDGGYTVADYLQVAPGGNLSTGAGSGQRLFFKGFMQIRWVG